MQPNSNTSQKSSIPKPTTSEGRLKANRANAQRSTGPCTPAGKAVSRFNAITHGILASKLLYTEAGEVHDHKLEELRQELLQKYGENDIRVHMLVDNLILECWRQQRSLHTELMYMRGANEQTEYWNTEFRINQGLMEAVRRYATASQNMVLKVMRVLDSYLKEAQERAGDEDQEYEFDDNSVNVDPVAAHPPDEEPNSVTVMDEQHPATAIAAHHPPMVPKQGPVSSAPDQGEASAVSDSEPAMTNAVSPNSSADMQAQSAASDTEAAAGGHQVSAPTKEPAPPTSAEAYEDSPVLPENFGLPTSPDGDSPAVAMTVQ